MSSQPASRIAGCCGAIVYLVGAGPGAPDLITARGLRCLQAADVVIYDHLVHRAAAASGAAAAERIDVGSAAPERFDQEAICYLIAEKAREGKLIARLKWGDPFVFDQGGVEALFLHEQGIPFEVVPGRASRRSACRPTPAFRSPTPAAATR